MGHIGKKIKHLLVDKSVEQKALAEAAEVSEVYISRVLSGKQVPSLAVTMSIADKLGVTIDELVKE